MIFREYYRLGATPRRTPTCWATPARLTTLRPPDHHAAEPAERVCDVRGRGLREVVVRAQAPVRRSRPLAGTTRRPPTSAPRHRTRGRPATVGRPQRTSVGASCGREGGLQSFDGQQVDGVGGQQLLLHIDGGPRRQEPAPCRSHTALTTSSHSRARAERWHHRRRQGTGRTPPKPRRVANWDRAPRACSTTEPHMAIAPTTHVSALMTLAAVSVAGADAA